MACLQIPKLRPDFLVHVAQLLLLDLQCQNELLHRSNSGLLTGPKSSIKWSSLCNGTLFWAFLSAMLQQKPPRSTSNRTWLVKSVKIAYAEYKMGSLGYAEKLSVRADVGGQLGARELSETQEALKQKLDQLATLVNAESDREQGIVVFPCRFRFLRAGGTQQQNHCFYWSWDLNFMRHPRLQVRRIRAPWAGVSM